MRRDIPELRVAGVRDPLRAVDGREIGLVVDTRHNGEVDVTMPVAVAATVIAYLQSMLNDVQAEADIAIPHTWRLAGAAREAPDGTILLELRMGPRARLGLRIERENARMLQRALASLL